MYNSKKEIHGNPFFDRGHTKVDIYRQLLKSVNPRPTKLFSTTWFTKGEGGGCHPPLEFVIRHPMPMTLVPVVSYDPPLTSDTKQVPTYQVYDVTAMKI